MTTQPGSGNAAERPAAGEVNQGGPTGGDPREIAGAGWKQVLGRSYRGVNDKNLFLIAGGVTYSVLLALFPALLALVSLYGLAFDPVQVERQVTAMSGLLPDSARQLIAAELHQLVSTSGGALSTGAIIGVLFALWTASRGMSGMMSALDIAYGETETRGFIRFNLVALVMTLALIVGGILAIGLVAGVPAVVSALNRAGAGGLTKWVVLIAEWPCLMIVIMTLLAVLYRFAPDRHPPHWRWVTPGAIAGTVLWVIGSILFSTYVANFSNYNATYGSLGAVVVLLTWLYLSAFVVLLGAEINAEAERQMRQVNRRAGRG